jgi:rhamnulokinase
MAATADYLALDLGAESGRAFLGRFDGNRVELREIHRFPNNPVKLLDTLYWNLPSLFDEIKTALRKASESSSLVAGIGIDTWGVDFGLVGRGDTLLGNPVHYRDARTVGVIEEATRVVSREEIYRITGLQFLPINTLYQLLSLQKAKSPLLEVAETLLMIPDLIGWLLTGNRAGEHTNASTTQLFDPQTSTWSSELCQSFKLPHAILPPLVEAGTELGTLRPSVIQEVRIPEPVRVIAPATHDTASAVVATPGLTKHSRTMLPDWCYLSSGTWSLLGVELPAPVINAETMRYNFTNERGVAGTTRLLRNIMGLWLVQESRRTWARAGPEMSYEELAARAQAAPPFTALIDPDDPSFLAPGDVPGQLVAFCRRTGQTPPGERGALVRTCLESLALKYRWTLERLQTILQTSIKTIHVVGGGAKNTLLCQLTANACNRPVFAGPIEATAVGNILMQAVGRCELGSIQDLRAVVARSFPVTVYEPHQTAAWTEAAGRFEELVCS